jgi:DNA replicative helicase MCM subunit Mcm2 (Cdc46/Mcm family)
MQPCNGRQFAAIEDPTKAEFSDYQEVKLQELFKTLQPGNIPRSIVAILENKLTESVKPGDDTMMTGVLVNRWKHFPPNPGQRPIVELVLVVNNVEVLNKREFQAGN